MIKLVNAINYTGNLRRRVGVSVDLKVKPLLGAT